MEKNSGQKNKKIYPSAMSIAGSDSSGGAGIQADLRTFNAFGVYACCAITAVTAQNPGAVTRIDPLPGAAVTAQIDAVLSAVAVRCCKSGMLFSPENVEALADAVARHKLTLICDPVMVSTSGTQLISDAAVEVAGKLLLPRAAWITPNMPEAALLLGHDVDSENAPAAAVELYEKYGVAVILKGGHAAKGKSSLRKVNDIVCRNGELWQMSSLAVDLPVSASHGTGCTLSAALCAMLALDAPWKEALCAAKAFVLGSLVENVAIGNGVYGMYPPEMDYMNSVKLEKIG